MELENYTDRVKRFIEELKPIKWFEHGGEPCEKYLIVRSVYEAYDNWNGNYLSVWEPHTDTLEKLAVQTIGDEAIDRIFDAVSAALDGDIWNAWQSFRIRAGLEEQNALDEEITEMAKRDLCWAAVENELNRTGFFTNLIDIYKDGYFPCGWDGNYPEGRAAVV